MYWRYFILAERFEGVFSGVGRRFVRFFSSFTTRGKITYNRKWLAKRKDESPDAYHSDVGCQERDGCKKVKERVVRPEAL